MAGTLQPLQMRTYFAFTEAANLLEYAVRQQLQADGDLSYVQFEILATIVDAQRALTMTELADRVVYSRSGLTHQAGLLERAALISRTASTEDQRATLVDITEAGRTRLESVLPGHIDIVRGLLFDALTDADIAHLADIMTRVRNHMRTLPPRSSAPRKPR